MPSSSGAIRSITLRDRGQDALAAVAALVAVAQLDRLVGAGRGARRHRRPADRAVAEDDVDLDRRIAARVEDLARVDELDRSCSCLRSRSDRGLPGLRLRRRLARPAGPGGRRCPAARGPRGTRARRRRRSMMWVILRGQALLLDRRDAVAATDDDRHARPRPGRRGSGRSRSCRGRTTGSRTRRAGRSRTRSSRRRRASSIAVRLCSPRSTMCHEAGIFSVPTVLYSVPRVTSLAITTSVGRTTVHARASRPRRGSAGRRRRDRARRGSCRRTCPGRAGTCSPSRRRGRGRRPSSGGARGR